MVVSLSALTLGTWVPLQKGRELAERNGVYEKLRPLFEYKAGDISPPQAPKHTTAASNKTKPLMKTVPRTKKIASAQSIILHVVLSLTNRTQSGAYLQPGG